MDPDFILMDDNAGPQRARVTNEYLQTATIVGMDWPARSSDLNPNDHAWDMVQTAISDRSSPANQGSRAATATTGPVGFESHNKAFKRAIRRRCRAVINSNGHHTRY